MVTPLFNADCGQMQSGKTPAQPQPQAAIFGTPIWHTKEVEFQLAVGDTAETSDGGVVLQSR